MTQEIRNMPFYVIPQQHPQSIPCPSGPEPALVDCVCRLYGSAIARWAIGGVLLGLSEAHWCGFGG